MNVSQILAQVGATRQRDVPDSLDTHVALSAVFDLLQQDLSTPERVQVVQHLLDCPACAQTFEAMVQHDVVETDEHAEPVLLAAAPWQPREEDIRLTEDDQHTLRFLRTFQEGTTAFTIEIQPDSQPAWEQQYVRVYADGALIWRGQIVQGRLSWQLPARIPGRLSVRREQPLP